MLKYLAPILFVTFGFGVNAQADDVTTFIENSYVPVTDCPSLDVLPVIEGYLQQANLSSTQRYELTVRKTHAQICMGKLKEAQLTLRSLLADETADRSAQYYTNAIYQYAFIYDVQENNEKCNYYRLARDNAKDRYFDISVSATLAYLVECTNREKQEEKISVIYSLLQDLAKSGDKAALAHAHNRVGLFYGDMGANQLAASQYMKAYEIGKEIYTYENQVPLLTSAMTSLVLNDELDKAKEILPIFKEVVSKTQSDMAKYYLYLSEAQLYTSAKDYNKLAEVLDNWAIYRKTNQNGAIANGLFRWYSSVLCLVNKDAECLQAFLTEEKIAPQNYLNFVKMSKEYLLFMTEVHLFLGDTEAAKQALNLYTRKIATRQAETQNIARNFGAGELHLKIMNLESMLAERKSVRNKVLIAVSVALLLIVILLLWFLRRKYVESQSYDSATGLLNSAAVISKLAKLPAPGEKRTNALAIFDIANFTEVNLTVGSSKGDYVLKKLADTFKKITRSSDILGRFGPGQFILCLSDIEEDAAQAFFERAKDALTNTFRDEHNGDPISVDSSMSIYYESGTFDDINEILDNMLLSLSMKS